MDTKGEGCAKRDAKKNVKWITRRMWTKDTKEERCEMKYKNTSRKTRRKNEHDSTPKKQRYGRRGPRRCLGCIEGRGIVWQGKAGVEETGQGMVEGGRARWSGPRQGGARNL